MRRTIRDRPGEITLFAIGPMTNVGLLFALDPEIPALLKSLAAVSIFEPDLCTYRTGRVEVSLAVPTLG